MPPIHRETSASTVLPFPDAGFRSSPRRSPSRHPGFVKGRAQNKRDRIALLQLHRPPARPEKIDATLDACGLRAPGSSTLSRPLPHAENHMSRVGRSSDFRVRFVQPSRRRAGNWAGTSYATMARRLDEPSSTRLQRRGPSRNYTGFPVRRPSHRSGRPPTHDWYLA